jgi:hypothetical protein
MKKAWFITSIGLALAIAASATAKDRENRAWTGGYKRDIPSFKNDDIQIRPNGDGSYRAYRDGVPVGRIDQTPGGGYRYQERHNPFEFEPKRTK